MNKPLLPALLLALAMAMPPATQALEVNAVQADRSSLNFVFHEMGVAVNGRFRRFAAQLDFDPARLAGARAALDLDLASIDAGSDEANDEVSGPLWFNTRAFPQAHFVSNSVRALGGNRYELSGKLSIKGRTQDVTAPFTFTPGPGGGTIDGAFALKRADFAIGEGMWADTSTVANEVQITFHFLASARK